MADGRLSLVVAALYQRPVSINIGPSIGISNKESWSIVRRQFIHHERQYLGGVDEELRRGVNEIAGATRRALDTDSESFGRVDLSS